MSRLLTLLLVVSLAVPALATSKNHFHRVDARQKAAAEAYLAAHGLEGVTVRAFRDRLVLGGALPSGDALIALKQELARTTGAASVHAD